MLRHPTLYVKRRIVRAPASLTASQVVAMPAGANSILLQWNNVETDLYTELWFSNGTAIGYVNPGAQQYVVQGLNPHSTYSFYATHAVGGGFPRSVPSNIASATTQYPLDAPYNFTVSQIAALPEGVTQLDLRWNTNGLDTVQVYRNPGGFITDLPVGSTYFRDSGLTANTTYGYVIRHIRNGYVADTPYTTGATQQKFDAPVFTSLTLSATPNDSSSTFLQWTNAQASDVVGILRYVGNGPWQYIINLPAGTTSWTDTGLPASTGIYYAIIHNRNGYTTAWSNQGYIVTAPTLVSPTGVSVQQIAALPAGVSQLQLYWTVALADHQVRVWRHDGTAWNFNVDLPAGTTSYTDTGLASNHGYTYIVRHIRNGVDSPDNGSNSGYNATQLQFNPPTITGCAAASSSAINLTWVNGQNDLTQVYRYDTSAPGWAWRATIGGGVTSWQDTGLLPNTGYYYALAHHRNGYETGWSNQAYAATLQAAPLVPINPGVQILSDGVIRFYWTIQTGDAQHLVYVNGGGYVWVPPGTNYYDVGVTPATTYSFQVQAERNGQYSGATDPVYGRATAEMIITNAPGGNWNTYDSGGYRYLTVYGGQYGVNYSITRAGTITRLLVAAGGNRGNYDGERDLGGGGGGGSAVFQATDPEPVITNAYIQVGDPYWNDGNTYYRDTSVARGGYGAGSANPDFGWGGNGGYSGNGYPGGQGFHAGAGSSAGGGGGAGAGGGGGNSVGGRGGEPGPGVTAWDGGYYGAGGRGGRGGGVDPTPYSGAGCDGDAPTQYAQGAAGIAKFRWPI